MEKFKVGDIVTLKEGADNQCSQTKHGDFCRVIAEDRGSIQYTRNHDNSCVWGGNSEYFEFIKEEKTGLNLSPDAPIITNGKGGQQSETGTRMDLLPPDAILSVSGVFAYGAKRYAPNNWKKIDVNSHLNHLLTHVFAYLAGDIQDDHLGHAATRALMALQVQIEEERGKKNEQKSV